MGFNGLFIKCFGFAFNNLQGALGAFADTGAESVAQVIGDHPDFAIHHCQGAFGATDDTLAATVASLVIDLHDFAFYFHVY